jgi:hypothetical protein
MSAAPQKESKVMAQLAYGGLRKQKSRKCGLERDTLSLAAFVSRPQAEAQIGAYQTESYITKSAVST